VAVVYPIAGSWKWGYGWLHDMGFHDFAGSTLVHSVGGWGALVGAIILGPRIGKFVNGRHA
jgi:Amt family ammonium transporter